MIRPFARSTLAPVVLALILGAGTAGALSLLPNPYAMGPPPGHTGGFGEPTCAVCHADATEGPATVTLEAPAAYVPGHSYTLAVRVGKPDLRRAGFQLAVRFATGRHAGRQAGTLEPLDTRARITPDSVTGVLYLSHSLDGTRQVDDGTAAWSFTWIAPAEGGAVDFHIAANASNDDDSEFGDIIVTRSVRLLARR